MMSLRKCVAIVFTVKQTFQEKLVWVLFQRGWLIPAKAANYMKKCTEIYFHPGLKCCRLHVSLKVLPKLPEILIASFVSCELCCLWSQTVIFITHQFPSRSCGAALKRGLHHCYYHHICSTNEKSPNRQRPGLPRRLIRGGRGARRGSKNEPLSPEVAIFPLSGIITIFIITTKSLSSWGVKRQK